MYSSLLYAYTRRSLSLSLPSLSLSLSFSLPTLIVPMLTESFYK